MNQNAITRLFLALALLCGANYAQAQWDFEYMTGIKMTQKPLSNSLIEDSPGLFGVTNDAGGDGFWIHWTDLNGITQNSQYYVKNGLEMNAYAIEHHDDMVYVTGEVDYGTGLKEMFIMSAQITGSFVSAAIVPYSGGLTTVGNDLVKISTSSSGAEFVAIGYVEFSSVKRQPLLVHFNWSLSSITPRVYLFNNTNTTISYIPTQGKMLHPSVSPNELIVVGNAVSSSFAYDRIFKMRVNTSTFNLSVGHINYVYSAIGNVYNPSVSTSANRVLIGATHVTSSGVKDAWLFPLTANGVTLTGDYLYDNGNADQEVIQVHESSLGNAVLAYNNIQGGVSTPNVGRIDLSSLNVVSNLQYFSVNDPRAMHAAFARSTGASTMYFACTNGNEDATRTIASTTATPCEFVADLDQVLDPLTHIYPTASLNQSVFGGVNYFELEDHTVQGQMVMCDGLTTANFKNGATSLDEVVQEDVLEQVEANTYRVVIDDVASIRLYDINGKELSSSSHVQGRTIGLDSLPKGVYVLSIHQENKLPIRVKVSR